MNWQKLRLEGFNITYRDLNEQAKPKLIRKVELEAEIAKKKPSGTGKVGFIEKEKALQALQHEFNELVQTLRYERK